MKHPIKASGLHHSWLLAWNQRCCPPYAVLTGPVNSALEQHLRCCPLCRRERNTGLPAIHLDPAQPPAKQTEPRPGELWSVSAALSGWGAKHRYYSSPVVLVVRVIEDCVNVVQTFGDPALAGPSDVLFDNGLVGFAESWNSYTLQSSSLEHLLGRVSDNCLALVLQEADRSPAEVEPGSLLWFFRQMEVETGWHFAGQALEGLFAATDSEHEVVEQKNLLADLRRHGILVPELAPESLPEDILACAIPADDRLPFAAADAESNNLDILVYTVEQGRVGQVRMVKGRVHPPSLMVDSGSEENTALLHVGGSCDLTDDNYQWLFRWKYGDQLMKPLPGQSGAENGVFWAVFPVHVSGNPPGGELLVRIIVHKN
jgi:hypothetical protein